MSDRRFIALASKSLIRRRILTSAGVGFRLVATSADESQAIEAAIARGDGVEDIAVSVAEAKALGATGAESGEVVLGVDQLLVFKDRILRKALSQEDAIARLKLLRGATHFLVCGVTLTIDGEPRWRHAETVEIVMRDASDEAIRRYVTGRGDGLLTSVACYEIEADGAQLIERLDGDYFSALGLPLFPTLAALRRFDALPL